MWHDLLGDPSAFFASLIYGDEELAAAVRARGCSCGGRLDRADYPRKPRGLPAEWDEAFSRRFSFCCAKEGCRRRSTPPSLRFFGRRVYVAATLLLVCARRVTPRQAGVPKKTARRWRGFFATSFVRQPFWQVARGLLIPPVDQADVARSLLSRFGDDDAVSLRRALRFLAPITTAWSPEVMPG